MKLRVAVMDEDHRAWEEFVASQPRASSYHVAGWRDVIAQSFGHTPYYLMAHDDAGRVHGVLPLFLMESRLFGRFLVSLPFVNYGGLLCESEGAQAVLLSEARKILADRGAEYVELRHRGEPPCNLPAKNHKVTMILGLAADPETQWQRFNAKLRNQIRKAEKSGLRVAIGREELLDGFYQVFCRNMRDLGTPVYGKDFFRNVLATFPEATRIISVLHEGAPIASGIAYWFRDTMEVPWASSIRDFKAFCPNNLLYWEAIRFAIGLGMGKFDFGRSTPGEGTYKFKEQWGAQPVLLHWQYLMRGNAPLPELTTKNPKYQLAIGLWKRLPVAVTRIIGPTIVKNIP